MANKQNLLKKLITKIKIIVSGIFIIFFTPPPRNEEMDKIRMEMMFHLHTF
jgi:hypothetical protein